MDTSTITGSSLLVRSEQIQEALSITMMKQAADRQDKMAGLLARNARQAPQPAAEGGNSFNFSTYA